MIRLIRAAYILVPPVMAILLCSSIQATGTETNAGNSFENIIGNAGNSIAESSPSENLSIQDELNQLESRAGLINQPEKSLVERLAALELKLLGRIKHGSLVERLLTIKAALVITDDDSARKHPEVPTDSSSAELKQKSQFTSQENEQLSVSEKSRSEKSTPEKSTPSILPQIQRLTEALPTENAMPPRFYRIEPPGEAEKEKSDYLDSILKGTSNRVMRFKSMPVSVYITPYGDGRYTRSCIEGFEDWERRSKGLIRFVQVAEPSQARIKVIWNRLGLSLDKENCAMGAHTVTKWKKNASGKMAVVAVGAVPVPVYIPRVGKKYQVPAQLIEVNLDLIDSKSQDIKFIVLKNIVTHELGHALGLLGHSQHRSDMMYPVTDENSRISQRDLNTIQKLYDLKVEIPL